MELKIYVKYSWIITTTSSDFPPWKLSKVPLFWRQHPRLRSFSLPRNTTPLFRISHYAGNQSGSGFFRACPIWWSSDGTQTWWRKIIQYSHVQVKTIITMSELFKLIFYLHWTIYGKMLFGLHCVVHWLISPLICWMKPCCVVNIM